MFLKWRDIYDPPRMRSGVHLIPYNSKISLLWINIFPHNYGIYTTPSPQYIKTVLRVELKQNFHIELV